MAHRRRSRRIQEKEQQQLQQEQGEEDEDASNIQYAKPWNAKANRSKGSDSKHCNIKTPTKYKRKKKSKSQRIGRTPKKSNISQCIEILQWMNACKYRLRLHGYFINKLIAKCNNNLDALQYIHCLIDDTIIEDNNDIITKTVLINAYSQCNNTQNALKVFHSINETNKDIVIIGAMINVLVNNQCYQQSLELYDKYDSLNNEVTNMLALKACLKSGDIEKGLNIINNKININQISLQHKNLLIDFYGKYGDIDNALKIFNSINIEKKDIYTINAMMKLYQDNNQNDKVLTIYDDIILQKDSVSH